MNHHQPSGDVAGGKDVRGGCAKLGVDLHAAVLIDLYTGGGKVECGGVCDPADGNDRQSCVKMMSGVALGVDQPDSGSAALEALDLAGIRNTWIPDACNAALTVAATS